MKSIEKIIKEVLLQEKDGNSTIRIDDSHFFAVLLEKGNGKKLWNFIGLFVSIILCISILITSFVFFINDVLLFQNTPKINFAGTIIPERSCKRETAIFLFCSAQRWANTGIQLQNGDEINISYSGGFNSDIVGLRNASLDNNTPLYKWISFSNEDTTSRPYGLLYDNIKGGYFGSLLYVIAGEMGVYDKIDTNIMQVKRNNIVKVQQNGILYLSVNDIYLTDSIIIKKEKENVDLFKDSIISKTLFDTLKTENTDLFFYNENKNSVLLSGTRFRELAETNKELFYQDNLGEVLVVVDIKRHISSPLSWRPKIYRWTEEKINNLIDNWSILHTIISISIFILAICVSTFICRILKKRKK